MKCLEKDTSHRGIESGLFIDGRQFDERVIMNISFCCRKAGPAEKVNGSIDLDNNW